jgi:acyl-coenzyme A synthetase/AMP-(fatty) acid ligase
VADLSSLQVVTSTGMVLRDELFEWFYNEGFPAHVRLNNISGGTDLAGCFGIGNSLSALYVGGCAGCSLGVPVEVFDATIEGGNGVKGVPVEEGVPGELVATSAFPNMPTQFWGDASGKKYHSAYFERFDSKAASQFQVKSAQWLLTRQQMFGRTGTLFPFILSQSSSCSTGELTGSSTPPASVSDRLRSIE